MPLTQGRCISLLAVVQERGVNKPILRRVIAVKMIEFGYAVSLKLVMAIAWRWELGLKTAMPLEWVANKMMIVPKNQERCMSLLAVADTWQQQSYIKASNTGATDRIW